MIDPSKIRKTILDMSYRGQTAHVGCALSIVEILTVLYNHYADQEIILSKGHGVMALYAIQAELGIIPQVDIDRYFSNGSRLHGLAPGFGSLGHGLPVAVGRALALKRNKDPKRVFCIVGDGESQEGSNWEAIQFASHHKLDNLTVIVDQNGWQALGRTNDILSPVNLLDKFLAFGFMANLCEGNSVEDLENYLSRSGSLHIKSPKCLIAQTKKGAGIPFMEDDNSYHYKKLTEETYQQAVGAIHLAKHTVQSDNTSGAW